MDCLVDIIAPKGRGLVVSFEFLVTCGWWVPSGRGLFSILLVVVSKVGAVLFGDQFR